MKEGGGEARSAPQPTTGNRFEAPVSGAGFIAGAGLSLADCSLYPLLAYMQRRGLDLGPWPGLAAYEARLRARASAQASRPAGWAPGRVGRADRFRLAAGV